MIGAAGSAEHLNMDHHALIEELRARRDDPLDFLARFCDEISGRFEISELEHDGGRYRVAAARRSDLQTQADGSRPLKLVLELESDRIKLGVIRSRQAGETPAPHRTVDVDIHTDEGGRIRCLPTVVAILNSVS
jgi:hypothetical protein